mmetsp:Transcript_21156/g.66925  ORF Transcript_21156/g.66925 Transcript_21156/m.66925 type:complete len:731 (+) Transcript_21156:129-2321(+)
MFKQARCLQRGLRTHLGLNQSILLPRGPIDEIRIFVWRNGDWHPLPEEQQRQIKECLKAGQTVFKVRQGHGYWTLDISARGGWVQVGRTKRRPVKFVEMPMEYAMGASPHAASSRGLNMRMPHGLAARQGRCLVDAIYAEWEAFAGPREAMRSEDFTKALRKSTATSSSSRPAIERQSARTRKLIRQAEDELLKAAVQELWADASLLPHEALHRTDWLHLRLLEAQAPSQFALIGMSDALREQRKLKGDNHLHWHLLDVFLLGCQRCKGPEDGLLSIAQLQDELRTSEISPRRKAEEATAPPLTAREARLGRNSLAVGRIQSEEGLHKLRRPPQGAEPQQGRGAKSQGPGGTEEAPQGPARPALVVRMEGRGWAQRVGRVLCPSRSPEEEEECEPALGRRPEDDNAPQPVAAREQVQAFLDKFGETQLQTLMQSYVEEEDFVTYYDFLNHMLERKRCPVRLHQYDLSAGKAWWLSPVLLCRQMEGIWHTGVVVFDREYWYGGRIFESKVGQTPYGVPTKVIDMGEATMRTRQELWHFVQRELQFEFTMSNYDVLTNNCNHFSDAVCSFLINQHIPEEVLRQPQMFMRTPVVSLFRAVLNHQLGGYGGDSSLQTATPEGLAKQGAGRGGVSDAARSTCTLTAEEEWEKVQEGDLVIYEYETGWGAVGRIDSREAETCDLHWLDLRLGQVHIEDDVPSGAVRLLPSCGPRREPSSRARLAARQRVAGCAMCV